MKAPVDSFSVDLTPTACVKSEPFDDVKSELVRVCVEKSAEEPGPPSEDKAWVSKHPALFVKDVLRANFSRVLYVQGHEALEDPPLIALVQIILHTLDVSFKKAYVGIVADRVDVRVFSPNSSLRLTVLLVSLLPLPDCSSSGHRHADLCFCLGSSRTSPPLKLSHSRRRNPLCCLQYDCRKGSLHVINTTTVTWRNHSEVVSDHCRFFPAQRGVFCRSS